MASGFASIINMADLKIEYSDMSKDMVNRVVQIVRDLERTKMDKDVALTIKKDFDANFFPTW